MAWGFMRQPPPEKILPYANRIFVGRRAEASAYSASAEIVDVEAEISTKSNADVQSVSIISENPWHLWQSGTLSLRNVNGERLRKGFINAQGASDCCA